MGAAFAGIIRVPLTSVIMIFEMTRDYSIIVPLMIANMISYFISSVLQHEPIYEALALQEGVRLPDPRGEGDSGAFESAPIMDRELRDFAGNRRRPGNSVSGRARATHGRSAPDTSSRCRNFQRLETRTMLTVGELNFGT